MSGLSPVWLIGIIAAYFGLLLVISRLTSRGGKNEFFFLAGRQSPWFVVAFGMIGASLSGVTFISIPGVVGGSGLNQAFSYLQVVMGYVLGYAVIALVLLPLYYKLQLTSIYTYLEQRFGWWSYKTGAGFFLLSRIIGASFRLYLVSIVLDQFILGPLGVPFALTVFITIALIWVYTYRGGINTIIWTDTLQTTFMLLAVIFTIIAIGQSLDKSGWEMIEGIQRSGYGKIFFFEGGWADPNHFFKQFLAGALITIVMTGLDQDMMQKNLTCRNLRDAQKNMFTFSVILVFANLLFLSLGALLYIYAQSIGLEIPTRTDQLYPMIALEHLSPVVGVVFLLGLIAAAYSSADSALTSLTTSFCVDFLGFETTPASTEREMQQQQVRRWVHLGVSSLLFFSILIFYFLNNDAVINNLFIAAGYTYGPLLGLYTFGLFTHLKIRDRWVLPVCILSPLLAYLLSYLLLEKLGVDLGFLVLALNGVLTFFGLLAISFTAIPEKEE